jgi:hypothetical protein
MGSPIIPFCDRVSSTECIEPDSECLSLVSEKLSASEKALLPILVAFPPDAVLRCWILVPKEDIPGEEDECFNGESAGFAVLALGV